MASWGDWKELLWSSLRLFDWLVGPLYGLFFVWIGIWSVEPNLANILIASPSIDIFIWSIIRRPALRALGCPFLADGAVTLR